MRYMFSIMVLVLCVLSPTHGAKKKGLFKEKGPCTSKLLPHMILPEVGDCLMTREAREWNPSFFKAVKKDVKDAKNHHDHGIPWIKEAEEVGDYLAELDKLANLQLQARPGHTPSKIKKHLDDAINALLIDEEDEATQEEGWSKAHGLDIWDEDLGVADLGPEGLGQLEADGIGSLEVLVEEEAAVKKHPTHNTKSMHAEKWGEIVREIEKTPSVKEKYVAEWSEYLGTVHKFKWDGKNYKIKTRDIAVVVKTDPKDGFALVKIFASVNPKDKDVIAKVHLYKTTPALIPGESVIFFNKMTPATKPTTEHGHKVTHIVSNQWFPFTPHAYKKLHQQVVYRHHNHVEHV